MFLLQLMLVATIFCAVHAVECKHPKPMVNFSVDKILGVWHYGAFESFSPKEIKKYEKAKCGALKMFIDMESKLNKWVVDMDLGATKSELRGTFTIPDTTKGYFQAVDIASNITYDVTVPCTDYTTWAVLYPCGQVTPNYISEFVTLLVRDPSKHDQLVSREDIKKCYDGILTKPLKQLRKMSHADCKPHKFD